MPRSIKTGVMKRNGVAINSQRAYRNTVIILQEMLARTRKEMLSLLLRPLHIPFKIRPLDRNRVINDCLIFEWEKGSRRGEDKH